MILGINTNLIIMCALFLVINSTSTTFFLFLSLSTVVLNSRDQPEIYMASKKNAFT